MGLRINVHMHVATSCVSLACLKGRPRRASPRVIAQDTRAITPDTDTITALHCVSVMMMPSEHCVSVMMMPSEDVTGNARARCELYTKQYELFIARPCERRERGVEARRGMQAQQPRGSQCGPRAAGDGAARHHRRARQLHAVEQPLISFARRDQVERLELRTPWSLLDGVFASPREDPSVPEQPDEGACARTCLHA